MTVLSATVDRKDFVKTTVAATATIGVLGLAAAPPPALATGRATLEQSYERYAPRIKAGGEFYQGDFKQMVAKADWEGIKVATGNVPPRKKEDLSVRSRKKVVKGTDMLSCATSIILSLCLLLLLLIELESGRWCSRPRPQGRRVLRRSSSRCRLVYSIAYLSFWKAVPFLFITDSFVCLRLRGDATQLISMRVPFPVKIPSRPKQRK